MGIKNGNQAAAPSLNSQNIPLPKPTLNPVTDTSQAGEIVNKNAFLPSSGQVDASQNKPNADQISLYVVREGDNLSEIADMFGVSVNTIRWANDLQADEPIQVGQILVILPVSGVQYTIAKGDTIKSIAKKFGADADEIIQFNNLSPDQKLNEGDTIIIPNGEYTEAPVSPQQKIPSLPFYVGYYLRPIEGGRKTQGIHGHNAVDLADDCGTPIMASASGEVIIARNSGWNAGYGEYVVISHSNGTQTLYAHMSGIAVSDGTEVNQGQVIGFIGHTGHTIPAGPQGCHVHFEIRGAKNPF